MGSIEEILSGRKKTPMLVSHYKSGDDGDDIENFFSNGRSRPNFPKEVLASGRLRVQMSGTAIHLGLSH